MFFINRSLGYARDDNHTWQIPAVLGMTVADGIFAWAMHARDDSHIREGRLPQRKRDVLVFSPAVDIDLEATSGCASFFIRDCQS